MLSETSPSSAGAPLSYCEKYFPHLSNGGIVSKERGADVQTEVLAELGGNRERHEGVNSKVFECSLIHKLRGVYIGLLGDDLS